jgi:PiT family inorganic phosphate transporter
VEYSWALIGVIIIALIFDFVNGLHDAANSIATVVATRVLKPHWAVLWAAFFNFIAFIFFETKVASTVGKGVIDPSIVDTPLIFSALAGAIIWNLVTWYWGLPSSSSHALIGGLSGAGIAKAGVATLNGPGLTKISLSIIGSPLLGLILGFLLMKGIAFLVQGLKVGSIDKFFRRFQLLSSALYSLGHGGNDAQKTMGIITVLLISSGHLQGGEHFQVPFWVILSCQLAMGFGTMFGGWKIVKTMGMKLTKLDPLGGSCAETGGAATLFLATSLGIPVSTTHTITGAILGVGTGTAHSKVKWGLAGKIVWAWIFTIPAAALISYLLERIFL